MRVQCAHKTRDINGENQPSPKTFIFGGFRGNFDTDDRLQGFWITPKTKKVTAILRIRIFNTIPMIPATAVNTTLVYLSKGWKQFSPKSRK